MEVDRSLIYAAWRFTTGANVHRVKEMIFAYELAMNLQDGAAVERARLCEQALRKFVYGEAMRQAPCSPLACGCERRSPKGDGR